MNSVDGHYEPRNRRDAIQGPNMNSIEIYALTISIIKNDSVAVSAQQRLLWRLNISGSTRMGHSPCQLSRFTISNRRLNAHKNSRNVEKGNGSLLDTSVTRKGPRDRAI